MGLLDDLKQQADLKQQDESCCARSRRPTKVEPNKNLLLADAKLKHGLPYWTDIFNSLNIIKPVVPRYYYIEGGAAKLENLLQCDYSCNGRRRTVEGQDYVEAIVLRFRCIADGKITIEKQSDRAIKRLHDHLFSSGLKFEVKEIRNDRGYRGARHIHGELRGAGNHLHQPPISKTRRSRSSPGTSKNSANIRTSTISTNSASTCSRNSAR